MTWGASLLSGAVGELLCRLPPFSGEEDGGEGGE